MVSVTRKRQKDDNHDAPIELCRLCSKSHGIMIWWRLKDEQEHDHVWVLSSMWINLCKIILILKKILNLKLKYIII